MRPVLPFLIIVLSAASPGFGEIQKSSASREIASLRQTYESALERLLLKAIKAGDVAAVTEVSLEIDRLNPGPPKIGKGESPVGIWKWIHDTSTALHANGLVSNGETRGIWKWTNRSKREIQIRWSSGFVDQIVISPDGKSLQGTSNEGYRFKAEQVPEEGQETSP